MRSCEYLEVNRASEKQTKLLQIRNFQFFSKNKRMNIHSEDISKADYLAITFESQKNGEKFQTIIQHRSKRTLCPVKAWSTLIKLILSYENTDESSTINYFSSEEGEPKHIKASDMILHLRSTCMSIGEDRLGFQPQNVGTHSIRTSFAMQLFLAGVKDFTIMLMGRWKSLAFLRYIRPQVQQFSKNLSDLMSTGSQLNFSIKNTKRNRQNNQSLLNYRNKLVTDHNTTSSSMAPSVLRRCGTNRRQVTGRVTSS